MPDDQWATPTDLPGWDVKAVAAHTAHLESILAGNPEETVEVGEPDHVTGLMGLYTEQGVVAGATRAPTRSSTRSARPSTARHTALLGRPAHRRRRRGPSGSSAASPGTGAALLRNRPLDVWMHEQDIRRAVDLPGGMDSAGGRHTAAYLAESLGLVLGKRVGASAGTTVVLDVGGQQPVAFVVTTTAAASAADDPRRPHGAPAHGARGVRRSSPAADATRTRARSRSPATKSSAAHPRLARGHPVTGRHADAWRLEDIPDQAGRTVLVTGTTLGGSRPPHRARAGPPRRPGDPRRSPPGAARGDGEDHPGARSPTAELEQLEVDLADLGSIRRAALEADVVRPDRRAGEQRRRDGARRTSAPSTGSSCRWRPTTSGRSC